MSDCKHLNTIWAHQDQKDCDEALCDNVVDVCDLNVCVDCLQEFSNA